MSEFYYMRELNVGLLVFACFVDITLLIGTITDNKRKSRFMMWFSFLLISVIIMIAGESIIWAFSGDITKILWLKLGAFLSFGFGAVVNSLFIYCLVSFVREKEKVSWRYANIFALFNLTFLIMVVISLFNGMLFFFDEDGWYCDGWAYGIVNIFDFITIIVELLLVYKYKKILSKKAFYTMLSFSVLPFMSMLTIPYWTPTPTYLSTTLSLILILILFHGEITKALADKEIQLAEKERQLANSRISIALSQLRPHFLYNVLNSIYYLCGKDTQKAQEAISTFSDYLRDNMSSIEKRKMIPFDDELNHTKTYLALEQIRFKNISISYDIQTTSFMCPPLSLQPLVENAVKHGLSKKRGGGTIFISTKENEDCVIIEVSDNGLGFDVDSYNLDKEVHIGINNVRERIKSMANGSFVISSIINEGTKAIITLPKKDINK